MSAHSRRPPRFVLLAVSALLGLGVLPHPAAAAPTTPPATTTPAKPPKPTATPATSAPAPATSTAKPAGSATTSKATSKAAAKPGNDTALDAIAAMVNDEPVLASDVEEQLFLFLQRSNAHPDSAQVDTLRRQVLDQLIDDKLLLAEAKQRLGGEEGFAQQLQRENTTEDRLRERYKSDVERQMTEQRLVQKMIPKKTVNQAEAEAYFLAHKDKFPKVPPQLKLQVIQITPSPDSSLLAAGRVKIEGLRKRIVAGEKFAKIAAEASDDPGSAKAGGDLSFFRRGQMEPALEDAAFALAPGKLSQPVRTPYGWHLVETIERDTVRSPAGKDSVDADGKPIMEVHARHILVKVTPTDADVDKAFELSKKVRDQAVKGADFATLVRKYSTFAGQATADGDLGFLSLGQMQPAIRAGLEPLKIGEVSEVLPNAQGFNIFKVNDRKPEREYTVTEIKDELPDAVAQEQFREKYDAWLKTLRGKAQIEYRDL